MTQYGPRLAFRGALLWVIVVIVGTVLFRGLVVVPAGHVGVKDLFGTISSSPVPAGLHLINPLAKIHKLSIRTQEAKEVLDVPSKEGLVVKIDVSLLYGLEAEQAPVVYKTIGPGYVDVVVEPLLRSTVRGVTSGYDAKALYTSARDTIASQIKTILIPQLQERGIRAENLLLRSITLPAILATAIERKLEAEQQAEQMRFVLDKERQEADRKRIEAQGIADYQTIVNKGLNELILRWKGIEATKELAASPNTKIVVVGAGKDGLPLILGQ
ncbi:MAG: prohibitin family protein [Candidatus Eisenbacteria bacterium]|jgi:regulator of protease activity HflC (stomatin/prohibitin superfamily)|nr:prohibitin family protein [Candidatus Eisenbacteria bacterium]